MFDTVTATPDNSDIPRIAPEGALHDAPRDTDQDPCRDTDQDDPCTVRGKDLSGQDRRPHEGVDYRARGVDTPLRTCAQPGYCSVEGIGHNGQPGSVTCAYAIHRMWTKET